jgi:hypothetical protein
MSPAPQSKDQPRPEEIAAPSSDADPASPGTARQDVSATGEPRSELPASSPDQADNPPPYSIHS